MKKLFVMIPVLFFLSCGEKSVESKSYPEHPAISFSVQEAELINEALGTNEYLDNSYAQLKLQTDKAIAAEMDVPLPGESGGYAHEKHKQNYRDMKLAGIMFTMTQDVKYAQFIKDMLDKYAVLYPTLGPHPMSKKQKPGRLFHQMLNETVWLLNTVQAYDCIYDWLDEASRENYETNIFNPMAEWFSVEHPWEFNRIHNHGMWTAASVGMYGLVIGNQHYIDMALYGTEKDGKGGFLAQVEHLFAPDGYYMEGAYYVRYALRPLLFFAEALERKRPDVKIYEFKDQIIKKAFYSALQMTYPNGVFIPINDASQSMDINAPGIIYGLTTILDRYGYDENLMGIAKLQKSIYLNKGGTEIADYFAKDYDSIQVPKWKSIEFTDGDDGTQGGFGILRTEKDGRQALLAMKYGVHGLGHGHFDKLHFMYYYQDREVIPDYGYSRWINIEPKYGGRYLPENNSWAKQTISHNTVVVDQISQNKGNRKAADKVFGERHYFESSNPTVQVMSAKANNHYEGIRMQRTMLLVSPEGYTHPVIIDIYKLDSETEHSYDYPLHFKGQIINTSFDYIADTNVQKTLGKDNGYQHLWKTSSGTVNEDFYVTWLDGENYYSVISDVTTPSEVYLTMIGANDPNYNLRNEPGMVYRRSGKSVVFASVIETHGYFSEAKEFSSNPYPTFTSIDIIGSNKDLTVVNIKSEEGVVWEIAVNNADAFQGEKSMNCKGQEYILNSNYSFKIK